MISIIIAAKDCENWIGRTIESLKKQTFNDWECIISVNGSSDSTIEKALSTGDSRFRVLNSSIANKSLAVNRAVIHSKNDIICILDADDLWHPLKLENQVKEFERANLDIIGTQIIYIDENDVETKEAPTLPTKHEDCVLWLKNRQNPIANSSVMYRKLLHDKVGYYDPEKFAVEDYDMWMRSMRAGLRFGSTNEKHLFHRLHKSSNFNSTNKQKICKLLVDEINNFHEMSRTNNAY